MIEFLLDSQLPPFDTTLMPCSKVFLIPIYLFRNPSSPYSQLTTSTMHPLPSKWPLNSFLIEFNVKNENHLMMGVIAIQEPL